MSRVVSAPVIVASVLLLLLAAAAFGWLWVRAGRPAQLPIGTLLLMLIPVVVLLVSAAAGHGNRQQLAILVWAVCLLGGFLPGYLVLRSGDSNYLLQWRFVLAYAALFLVLILPFLLWLATWAARVLPARATMAVSEYDLKQRLRSLEAVGLNLKTQRADDMTDRLIVYSIYRGEKRKIAVRLAFLRECHTVLAREVSLVKWDKPSNQDEANMRMGTQPRDGTHPDADLIYSARINVTPPNEAIRQQLAMQMHGNEVVLAPEVASTFDPGALPHVLMEVVQQSGWTWQGVFFDWQGRCH